MFWLEYIVVNTAKLLLNALSFAMFARAILSWLPLDDDNKIESFLYAVTEPVITPVRMLVERSETLSSFPIDISFFITMVLLSLISGLLP